jgi:menaquinone-9 beta-reductase
MIVGAGPAGLAVAIAARREGLSVRVIDKAPGPPIDKACGEGLMPDGVAALARMGVDLGSLGGAPFAGIRYVDGAVTVEGEFPGEPGLGVRRTRLHAALAERAAAVGVEVEWGARVVGLEGGEAGGGTRGRGVGSGGRWAVTTADGERLEAGVVVGADGLRSRVRQWAGLDRRGDAVASTGGDAGDGGRERPATAEEGRPVAGASGRREALGPEGATLRVRHDGSAEGSTGIQEPAVARADAGDDGLADDPGGAPVDTDRRAAHEPASPSPAAPANDPAARFGVRRHYRVPAAELPRVVEVWWGEKCEAYVTPVGPEEVGVAMLWSGRKAGFDALLAGFPRLAARFVGRPVVSDDRGAGPLLQRVRGVVRGGAGVRGALVGGARLRGSSDGAGGGLALVGDASGYVDAITGEGLSLAFAQAEALVAGVAAGDLATYATAHRRLGRVPNTLTRLLLAVERRPALRRRAIRALAAEPALFSLLLAIHARQRPATAFFPVGAARLAWRLARPAD